MYPKDDDNPEHFRNLYELSLKENYELKQRLDKALKENSILRSQFQTYREIIDERYHSG